MPLYNVQDARGARRSLAVSRSPAREPDRIARAAGAGARVDRHLRGAVLHDCGADAGSGRPPGARRAAGARSCGCCWLRARAWPALGIGAGLLLSFALTGVVANQLYGLTPTDPVTMTGASALPVRRRPAGVVHPGVARDADRSGRGAASEIAETSRRLITKAPRHKGTNIWASCLRAFVTFVLSRRPSQPCELATRLPRARGVSPASGTASSRAAWRRPLRSGAAARGCGSR